jgi:hypothetical protein
MISASVLLGRSNRDGTGRLAGTNSKGGLSRRYQHLWLRTAQVAERLGISVVSVNKRCRADRLPYVEKAGRRWIKMDHLELVERALHAQEERCP